MKDPKQDAGTIAALMARLQDYRLPRARRMLEKVDRGETLNDSDLGFLKRVYDDSRNMQPLIQRHPEYNRIVTGMIDLYGEIIGKALENEKAQNPGRQERGPGGV